MSKKKSGSPAKKEDTRQKTQKKGKNPKAQQRDKSISQQIVAFFKANRDQAFTTKQVASQTGLWSRVGTQKIRSILVQLRDAGRVESLGQGRWRYLGQAPTLSGQIQVTRSGAGFLLREGDEDDIYINPFPQRSGLFAA